jgi:ABC-type glycerol-3-phosphate transport system substrate-binding protein
MCCAVPTTTSQLTGVDWAFVPFPKAKAAVPDMGGTIIAIWPATKSADTAWTFLRYAVDQGRLANLELRMPSQVSAIAGYVQQNYGSMPGVRPEVFLKTADFIPAPDPLFQTPASDEADKLINGTFKDVAAGNKTVRAALTELKPQLQALLDQYRDV